MLFKFKAIKQSGESYEETREAADKLALFDELRKNGVNVTSVEELDQKRARNWRKVLLAIQPVRTHDKIILTRNLGAMLEAGLPLSRALSVMGRQTRNPNLKQILFNIGDSIKKGVPLSI